MPEKFDGNMILFRASEQPVAELDPHLGWDSFVNGKVRSIVVKGTHGALTVYPFAADLAAKLEPFLLEELISTQSMPQAERHRVATSAGTIA